MGSRKIIDSKSIQGYRKTQGWASDQRLFFYMEFSKEFKDFGLIEAQEFDEPIKHIENQPPLKCILVKCKRIDK